MNSAEKIARCMAIEPVNDRSEIPVIMQIITYAGVCAGVTQKEIHENNDSFLKAKKFTYDTVGYPDGDYFLNPGDTCFAEALPVRRPGIELPDNELFQFVETENMQPEDYDDIAKNGWDQWNMRYMMRIQNPPYTDPNQLFARWGALGANAGTNIGWMMSQGVQPIIGSVVITPFDCLSLIRSFNPFIMDLYDEPDRVQAAINRMTDDMIASTLQQLNPGVPRVGVFAMRSDAAVLSPALFDEFSWPSLKKTILAFWEAGYVSVVHADGNWVPMLDRFLELPKGCVSFEFDGVTDMRKAYEIIGGWQSMRGDVSAVRLSFDTKDQVREYCEGLVTDLGMKGGFMLGPGCEVPMSAKAENVKAIFETIRG